MNKTQWMFVIATLLAAVAMWLLLPRGNARRTQLLGALLGLLSLGLFGAQIPQIGGWGSHTLFLVLAGITVISSAATVTLKNPVYCAIWFAMSLLGTAGLFLCLGAQFLGVATIVVYAGAILVTFLFVLMLANPGGHAYYDRLSWEALLSASAGAVMIGVLTMTFASVIRPVPVQAAVLAAVNDLRRADPDSTLDREQVRNVALLPGTGRRVVRIDLADSAGELSKTELAELERLVARRLLRQQAGIGEVSLQVVHQDVLSDQHMASLGAQLFSRHLIEVELAGTLLMVALVGAVAIVAHSKAAQLAEREAARG